MPHVKVDGLSKLRKELKQLDAQLPKDLNKVSKDAAEIVAEEGRNLAPVLSGRLRSRIKAAGLANGGVVRVNGLPYAKPIHFGWRAHNIEPNPFLYDALDSRRDEVIAKVRDGVHDLVEKTFTPGV